MAEKAGEFEQVSSFEALYKLLDEKGRIAGSNGRMFDCDYLKEVIESFRELMDAIAEDGEEGLTPEAARLITRENDQLLALSRRITRNQGLRKTVRRLAIEENLLRPV